MKRAIECDEAARLPDGASWDPVTEAVLDPLPASARRYLRFMGVVGRPPDVSFRLAWTGRFRRSLQARWMSCQAWQYNTRLEIARIFRMRLRIAGVVPLVGHDTYIAGHGRLRVRLLDLFTVADASGPELDVGELVTWLDDAVLFAPSMLLGPAVSWTDAGDEAFDVEVEDHGHRVRARVFMDARGAPRDVATTDRFCEDPSDSRRLRRARWTTPIDRWGMVEGRPVPIRGRAVWHLPEGEFPYAELEVVPTSLAWNVAPPE